MKRENRVVHFEIQADDCARASKFYSSVFGWTINKWEGGAFEYYVVMTGEGSVEGAIHGGLLPRGEAGAPVDGAATNAFVCTIEVADVDSTLSKVKENGGVQVVDTQDIPQVGKMAYCKDTEGNIFGIITSSTQTS